VIHWLQRSNAAQSVFWGRARWQYRVLSVGFYCAVFMPLFVLVVGPILIWSLEYAGVRLDEPMRNQDILFFLLATPLLVVPLLFVAYLLTRFFLALLLRLVGALTSDQMRRFAAYGEVPSNWLKSLPPNQPLHPTPNRSQGSRFGAGERRR
jgi:hypothetical protein